MASFHRTTSRYNNTSVKDFYLDLWDPVSIPTSANDTSVVITEKYDGRPDLLANDTYGSTRLWWVFAIRNPDVISDPLADFKPGVKIMVPSLKTVERLV